jgi:hypothetical protein
MAVHELSRADPAGKPVSGGADKDMATVLNCLCPHPVAISALQAARPVDPTKVKMASGKRTHGESQIILAAMHTTRRLMSCALLVIGLLMLPGLVDAEMVLKPIPTQYIAALGDPGATSGVGAESWGLWRLDPGPRGVRLSSYETLKAEGGVAPAQWKFDGSDWWVEEHGLIMEQPEFPIPPGRYVVTGGREVTAVLTIHPKGDDGLTHWELDKGATLYDVTHLRCRSARYTPAAGDNSCSPAKAQMTAFPVAPGAPMPPVEGCNKQDYEVLIVIGMAVDS